MLPHVVAYSAPANYFHISHGARRKLLAPYTPLDAGDRVVVVHATFGGKPAFIDYADANGITHRIDATNSPYCIDVDLPACKTVAHVRQTAGPLATILRNLQMAIAAPFASAEEWVHRRRATMVVRGGPNAEPPAIPMLDAGTPAQVDGNGFAIGWLGGAAPFRVRIIADSGAIRYDGKARERALAVRGLMLSPGRYTLEITDRDGRDAAGEFEVVALQAVPLVRCPHEAQPEEYCVDLEAGRLAARGLQWHLAAYKRLAFAGRLTQPGHVLQRWLAEVPP